MPHASPAAPPLPPGSQNTTALTAPLRALLAQLGDLLRETSDERYTAPPPVHLAGTLGGHVRHTLDHIAVLGAITADGRPAATVLDYDDRERGTDVETSVKSALDQVAVLDAQLQRLDALPVDTPVDARLLLAPELPCPCGVSCLAREVAFVLSHTVHHQALIAAHLRATGRAMPEGFGVAPSTLRHRAS